MTAPGVCEDEPPGTAILLIVNQSSEKETLRLFFSVADMKKAGSDRAYPPVILSASSSLAYVYAGGRSAIRAAEVFFRK
jgi:hypothetical protein